MTKIKILFFLLAIALNGLTQTTFKAIKHDNKIRGFLQYLPKNFELTESLPLVINMHGFTLTGKAQMDYTKFNAFADSVRCIVVYPNGIDNRWNSGSFFGVESDVDDVGFLSSLIDYMAVHYNIDTRRVYSTGYSAGGFMSYKLACDLTNRISAIAPIVGSMVPDNFNNCNPKRSMPIIAFNGTADPVTIYQGFVSVTPIEQVIQLWRDINNCDSTRIDSLPNTAIGDRSKVVKFRSFCDENVEVILMKVLNGGHTWPGAEAFNFLGNTNQDISANKEMWHFFEKYQIPIDVICDAPQNLSFTDLGDSIFIKWEGTATSYSVYANHHSGDQWKIIENIVKRSIRLPKSESEQLLHFAVKSNCESGYGTWTVFKEQATPIIENTASTLKIYPNPSNGLFSIPNFLNAEVLVFDYLGNEVYKSIDKDVLDLRHLPNGQYFIMIGEKKGKVVVIK